MAVGSDNTIISSTDGITWKDRSLSAAPKYFTDVSYNSVNDTYVAVGWYGPESVATSTDGNGLFVAVGVSGTIITSPEGKVILPRQGRLSATEPEVGLRAITYPNPVDDDFTVAIDGASGQAVRLWLVDTQGHTLVDRQVEVTQSQHQEPLSLGQHLPGIYLLRVSTASQTTTLKVLKR
jgi:Secretion system C-terminal sorting domain